MPALSFHLHKKTKEQAVLLIQTAIQATKSKLQNLS
jgi:hypothetical protein